MDQLEVWTALMTWLSRLAFSILNGDPLLIERTCEQGDWLKCFLRLSAVNIPKFERNFKLVKNSGL